MYDEIQEPNAELRVENQTNRQEADKYKAKSREEELKNNVYKDTITAQEKTITRLDREVENLRSVNKDLTESEDTA